MEYRVEADDLTGVPLLEPGAVIVISADDIRPANAIARVCL